MRIGSGVVFTLYAMNSVDQRNTIQLISNVLVGALLVTGAIAPTALYDGRWEDWLRAHRVLRAVLTALMLVAVGFVFLSVFVDD
jgi:hypothetical protein